MDNDNISTMIQERARRFGPQPALSMHGDNAGENYSYAELERASGTLADFFIENGLLPDDRVAILCESRPRWGVAFFGALRAGGIALPLDVAAPADDLAATLDDASPRYLLVSAAQEPLAAKLLRRHAGRVMVLSLEPVASNPAWPSIDGLGAFRRHGCVSRRADDAAVLTYTSGTMGRSKGVVTTFGNLLFQVRACRQVMGNDAHCTAVSILPLSHLFELTAGFLSVLHGGGHICYCNSLLPTEILGAMQANRVSCMTTVPLFLKLIERGIRNEIGKRPAARRVLCRAVLACAPFLPLAIRRRVFGTVHRRFGGRLEYFVCGGAPLDTRTLRFFSGLGVPVYQGYGLAETSPVIATNAPRRNRIGSVGRPLPGVELRIGETGEILTRGPHLMRGYYNDEVLTRRVIDNDGWLHTGDIGRLDANGFLYVAGREKNIIVLGSGLKVQPEELEAILFEHPDIQEGCVVAAIARHGIHDGSEIVCAITVPSEQALHACDGHPDALRVRLARAVEERARLLAPAKRPARIVMRREPLPRTSTRKIRRQILQQWLAGGGLQA